MLLHRGHHQCNYEKSHLSPTASFIQNQRRKYNTYAIRNIPLADLTIVLLNYLQTGQTINKSVEDLQSRVQQIKETGELAPGMMFKSACQMQKERAKI